MLLLDSFDAGRYLKLDGDLPTRRQLVTPPHLGDFARPEHFHEPVPARRERVLGFEKWTK